MKSRSLARWLAGVLLAIQGPARAWFEAVEPPAPLTKVSMTGANEDWGLGSNLEVVEDELLETPVWQHQAGRLGWMRSRIDLPESFVVRARVRILSYNDGVTLSLGATGSDARPRTSCGLTVRLMENRRGRRWLRVQPMVAAPEYVSKHPATDHGLAGLRTRPSLPQRDFSPLYSEAPSPLLAEESRRELEAALAQSADRLDDTGRWLDLRIDRDRGQLRFWVNGVPAGRAPSVGPLPGDVHLRLDRSVRVARLEVTPLASRSIETFEPVDLTDRLNAAADDWLPGLGSALPRPDEPVFVTGRPFLFSRDLSGRDHVDLGPSLLRQRNLQGHAMARVTWPAPHRYDPARIMFWVPNRAWRRLWLIAASDDDSGKIPRFTARFFKPSRGFPVDAAGTVPGISAESATGPVRRLSLPTPQGQALWEVPLELDSMRIASEMRDSAWLGLELTKDVQPYRGYPDPANYGAFQAGPPSGVRVFAMTLEAAPLIAVAGGNRHGNVYVSPEQPLWQVDLVNPLSRPVSGRIRLRITDHHHREAGLEESAFSLPANGAGRVEFPLEPSSCGLHAVRTEIEVDGDEGPVLARAGTFVQLPPEQRQATLADSPWSLGWSFTHDRHDVMEDVLYLLRAAGARGSCDPRRLDVETARQWGVRPSCRHVGPRSPPAWAFEDSPDPDLVAETRDTIGKSVAGQHTANPLIPSFSVASTESSITPELTYGIPRRYLGEDPAWTEEEQRRIRGHMVYARAACEGIREHAPDARIALGWAGAGYAVPLLESGLPRELFDTIGLDVPVFERTPEMPVREVTAKQVWFLRQAMLANGYEDLPVIHTESYYPNSNPMGLGWRRSADHYVRLMLLSRAMIPKTRFAGVLGLQDCASYWGSQHYGEHGVIGRQPEANPKPAFSAFATMTRLLDPGEYQGWIPTGSLSAYGLHFTSRERHVYALWTLRGRREARLRLPAEARVRQVDEGGNESPLRPGDGWVAVELTPTPRWVVANQPVEDVALGPPDHDYVPREHPVMAAAFADGREIARPENAVAPGPHKRLLDPLETPWPRERDACLHYETTKWSMPRHWGPMRSETVADPQRKADVWQITLDEPAVTRELTAWYGSFAPPEPIPIPGRARALGLWVEGRSNWGRIVYEVEDAEGEVWRSVGTRESHNCDDIHTWSYFNFDGWRFLEFPLPSHEPYDNYRHHDTVWWGSDGGNNVVDLPLRLRRIFIEQRTHLIYVDRLLPVPDRGVRLHRLYALYENAENMTDTPVRRQREWRDKLTWEVKATPLPNPMATLRAEAVGDPTRFESLAPPDDYNGMVTELQIRLGPVTEAREYRIYVAAYEDGRGAQVIARGAEPTLTVRRLQPGFPLYLFATWVDAEGRESRPTAARRILLVDEFPFR